MPSRPVRDAIVIALDIGKSVSTLQDYEDKSFFDQAVECVSWIIQRKIISQSVDVLSLILIGCNTDSDSSNVTEKFEFQVASWDMLKFIKNEVKPTNYDSDWFKALIVSAEMLRAYDEYNTINNRKIVIFSDFTQPASDDLDVIVRNLEKVNIEVTIIGPDHLYLPSNFDDHAGDNEEPECKRKKTTKLLKRQEGEKIVYDLWKNQPEKVGICTFESALKQLCSYTPKSRRINYWNCIMDIGEVNIKISMVKKTDPKPPRKFSTKCIKLQDKESDQNTIIEAMVKSEQTTSTIRDTVMHYKHESGGDQGIIDIGVQQEDTIVGFRYGRTIIPFSEEDKIAMEYKAGPKSFSVIGFTHTSKVPYYLLSGECSYLVVPRDKDKNAEVALSAIIQAMKKMECLAIVKRVYNDNWGLSLGILYPTIEEIYCVETDDVSYKEYLLFVELAFEDDVKSIDFPSLDRVSKKITQKQYDAIDSLIDGMNLMKADKGLRGEPCEAFDLPFLHDFKEQFFQYCVIHRGLNPDEPLPTSIPPYIKKFIDVPKSVEEKCKSAAEDIKKQFDIKKTSQSNNKMSAGKQTDLDADSENGFEHFVESEVVKETNATARMWMRLFQNGFPSDNELDDVFIKLRSADTGTVLSSFGRVISQIRSIYLNQNINPNEYNQWMKEFKKYLDGKGGLFSEIWGVIVSEYAGLVTKEENQLSRVMEEEANEYLVVDVSKVCVPQNEKPKFDFLDELQAEQMDLDSSFF